MKTDEIEHAVISNAVNILCVLCGGDRKIVIDLLTGYLWDEEEAGKLKYEPIE